MNHKIPFRGWKTAVKFAQVLEEECPNLILDSLCIRRESYIEDGKVVAVVYLVYWTEQSGPCLERMR